MQDRQDGREVRFLDYARNDKIVRTGRDLSLQDNIVFFLFSFFFEESCKSFYNFSIIFYFCLFFVHFLGKMRILKFVCV